MLAQLYILKYDHHEALVIGLKLKLKATAIMKQKRLVHQNVKATLLVGVINQ